MNDQQSDLSTSARQVPDHSLRDWNSERLVVWVVGKFQNEPIKLKFARSESKLDLDIAILSIRVPNKFVSKLAEWVITRVSNFLIMWMIE